MRLAVMLCVVLIGAARAEAETRVVRDAGPCMLPTEGSLPDRRIEPKLALRMDYRLSVYASPEPKLKLKPEHINASLAGQVHVTNRSQSELYFRCDIAFFTAAGDLVGGLSWESKAPTQPLPREGNYAFTVAYVPKERVAEIAAYKAVVHESDTLLGIEPTGAGSAAESLGSASPVVLDLTSVAASSEVVGDVVEDRTSGDLTFRTATGSEPDPAFEVGSAAGLHLRVSPILSDQQAHLGTGKNRKLVKVRRWRLATMLEDDQGQEWKPRDGALYLALLDAAGGLVCCARTAMYLDWIVVVDLPPDQLFSATRLDAVLYRAK